MTKSGLPKAKNTFKTLRIGNIIIKTEKPTESRSTVEKSIDTLKNAANKKIFIENADLYL